MRNPDIEQERADAGRRAIAVATPKGMSKKRILQEQQETVKVDLRETHRRLCRQSAFSEHIFASAGGQTLLQGATAAR